MSRYTNMMRLEQVSQVFIVSGAVLLLLTGVAKLFSLTGSVGILDTKDPVFAFLSIRQLLLLAAVVEIGVASLALGRTAIDTKLLLIAWLGALFGVYRLGLWLVGYQEPCKCLGGALDSTGLSDVAIRSITFGMFVYLLAGSCILLLVNLLYSHLGYGAHVEKEKGIASVAFRSSQEQLEQSN